MPAPQTIFARKITGILRPLSETLAEPVTGGWQYVSCGTYVTSICSHGSPIGRDVAPDWIDGARVP